MPIQVKEELRWFVLNYQWAGVERRKFFAGASFYHASKVAKNWLRKNYRACYLRGEFSLDEA
jgi:hypothetical protein